MYVSGNKTLCDYCNSKAMKKLRHKKEKEQAAKEGIEQTESVVEEPQETSGISILPFKPFFLKNIYTTLFYRSSWMIKILLYKF